ncbi:MAG: sigma-70 family RNA polymerase sigma factor [Proteobacteria bacterium]|nr:sigma-70 family RNA polymerase sigma factor [Pseudomonadota bacterium]
MRMAKSKKNSIPFVRRKKLHISPEEEIALIKTCQKTGDENALERIMDAHLPFCRMKARQWSTSTGLDYDDLLQEARIGFIIAVRKFDATAGASLLTYAGHWMMQRMQRHTLKFRTIQHSPPNVAPSDERILNRHDRMLKKWEKKNGIGPMTPEEESEFEKKVGLPLYKIAEIKMRRSAGPLSLDIPLADGDGNTVTPLDFLAEEGDGPFELSSRASEARFLKKMFNAAGLTKREAEVMAKRHLNEDEETRTLEDVGNEIGVTRERVRQIEAAAFEKLKAVASRTRKPQLA